MTRMGAGMERWGNAENGEMADTSLWGMDICLLSCGISYVGKSVR